MNYLIWVQVLNQMYDCKDFLLACGFYFHHFNHNLTLSYSSVFILCVRLFCLHMCLCTHVWTVLVGPEKDVESAGMGVTEGLLVPIWVLRTNPGPSARTSVLYVYSISSASQAYLLKDEIPLCRYPDHHFFD